MAFLHFVKIGFWRKTSDKVMTSVARPVNPRYKDLPPLEEPPYPKIFSKLFEIPIDCMPKRRSQAMAKQSLPTIATQEPPWKRINQKDCIRPESIELKNWNLTVNFLRIRHDWELWVSCRRKQRFERFNVGGNVRTITNLCYNSLYYTFGNDTVTCIRLKCYITRPFDRFTNRSRNCDRGDNWH